MALLYATGEDIQEGDRIVFDDLPGEIELVADPESPTDETDWYVEMYGGGVSIAEPTVFGRLFLRRESIDDRLVRGSPLPGPPRRENLTAAVATEYSASPR